MYAADGGDWSPVIRCARRSSPSAPDASASRAARYPTSKRRWNPMCTRAPTSATRSRTRTVPFTSPETGFSPKTGGPAAPPGGGAGVHAGEDEVGVRVGRGGDHQRVDPGPQQLLGARRVLDAEVGRDSG